jgi:hypothetical protein
MTIFQAVVLSFFVFAIGVYVGIMIRDVQQERRRRKALRHRLVVGQEGWVDSEGIPDEVMLFGRNWKRVKK